MIFDTHAHYDDAQFDEDRETLLASLSFADIRRVIDVGSDVDSLPKVMALAKRYDFISCAIGLHPDEVGDINDTVWQNLCRLAEEAECVAIGEIGLDYYWDKENHELQKKWFRAQIELALKLDKPIIVHSREAAEDTLSVIREYYGSGQHKNPGIIHCFSYSAEMAELYVRMGFYLGIGGVVTYKNGRRLKETVQRVPLERLVLETDCPYLSPVPNRGKRNSSLNLPYVAEEIARLKEISREEVEKVTYRNAENIFGT